MEKVRFGKTDLIVSKIAFGGIPIQRLSKSEAVGVVRGVIALGINFLDTANGYTDSEEKIGEAIKGLRRDEIVLASKSGARDKKTFVEHLDLSLKRLGTDYVDLYQHHGVSSADDYERLFAEGGVYEAMADAVRAGKIRYPAVSSHSVALAPRIIKEGKFAAIQLPFNFVDDEAAKKAIPLAREYGVGFIAMKPFGGGLLSDAGVAIRYLSQYDSIIPDPGIERLSEMEEIVRIVEAGGGFSEADAEAVERTRAELGARWCHRCNYCQPCPQKIGISTILCLESFIRRMPYHRVKMIAAETLAAARTCTECRACVAKCPYDLDIPELIKEKIGIWVKYEAENG